MTLISGTANGIGRCAAELFAAAGSRVVINDIDPAEAGLANELIKRDLPRFCKCRGGPAAR